MKTPKILFTILILFCLTAHGQTKEDIIKKIRGDFKSINSDTSLKKITLQDEEFLENAYDGGAELTGFYKKNSIVKIVEWVGLSYGNSTREFYFKDNKLFFVFEKFESFIETADGGLDHSKVKTAFEGRYYFNKEQLLEKKTTGKIPLTDPTTGKELIAQAKENIKLLSKKKP